MRLPGEPLCEVSGKTMIQHVDERALESDAEKIIIATDDRRIQQVAEGFGTEVCMTSDSLRRLPIDLLKRLIY